MKLKKNIRFAWLHTKRFSITFFLYGLFSVPLQWMISLIPSSDIQIAAFIPTVFGILWGPTAAIGMASASLVGDFVAGRSAYIGMTTAVAVFFQAFLSYKLWYTFRADERAVLFFADVKEFFRFLWITALALACTSAMQAIAWESSNVAAAKDVAVYLWVRTFDAAVLFGAPTLLVLSPYFTSMRHFPKADQARKRPAEFYNYLPYLSIMVSVGYIAVAAKSALDNSTAFFCWIVMFLILSLFMQKPVQLDFGTMKINYGMSVSLLSRAAFGTVVFGLLSFLFIGIVIVYAMLHGMVVDYAQAQMYFYQQLLYFLHLYFLAALLYLWRVQRTIVCPLRSLALIASGSDLPALEAELLKCISRKDEVGVLARSIARLHEHAPDVPVSKKDQ